MSVLDIIGNRLAQGKYISAVMKFLVVTSQEEDEDE